MERKKIIKIISIVLGLLLLIIIPLYPYFFGIMAEKSVNEILADVKSRGKDSVDVTYNFQREYAKSKLNIEIRQLNVEKMSPTISLNFDINHFKMNALGMITPNRDFEVTYLTNFNQIPKINVEANATLLGKLKFNFKLTDFAFKVGENEKAYDFVLSPTEFAFYIASGAVKYTRVLIPSIVLNDSKTQSKGSNIEIEWEKSRGIKTLDSSLKLKLKEFNGSDYTLKNGDLYFGFLNLDNKVVDKISDVLVNLKDVIDSENKTGILMELAGLLPRLVERNPRVELKIKHLETNSGNVDLNAFLGISSDGPVGILNFLQSLESKIVLNAPQDSVERILEEYLYWGLVRTETSKLQDEHQKKMVQKVTDANKKNQPVENEAMPKLSDAELAKLRVQAKGEIQEKIGNFFEKKYIVKKDNGVFSEFILEKGEMKVNGAPFYLSGGNG